MLEAVVKGHDGSRQGYGSDHVVSALALKGLDRSPEAERLFADWQKSLKGGEDAVLSWARAVFNKDAAAQAAVLENLKAGEKGKSWDLGTGDRNIRLVMAIAALGSTS